MSMIYATATDATDSWRISYRDIIGKVRTVFDFQGTKAEAEAEITRRFGILSNPDKSATLTPLNNYILDKPSPRSEADELKALLW